MDDNTDKAELASRLAEIAVAVLDWREACKDGPDTLTGQAMQRIWRLAMGDPDVDLWVGAGDCL